MPSRCLVRPERTPPVRDCDCEKCTAKRKGMREWARRKRASEPDWVARGNAARRRKYAADPDRAKRICQSVRDRYERLKDRGWCVHCGQGVAISEVQCWTCLTKEEDRYTRRISGSAI